MGKKLYIQAICLDPNPSSVAFDDIPLQYSSGVFEPNTPPVSDYNDSASQVIEESFLCYAVGTD